jgi:hypothetical protein
LKGLRRSSALAGIVIKLRNSLALGMSGHRHDEADEMSAQVFLTEMSNNNNVNSAIHDKHQTVSVDRVLA